MSARMQLAVVAMSGGVDSSVAAALVADDRDLSHTVGIAPRLSSSEGDLTLRGRTCCAPDDLYDARRAAARLGVRFHVYDAQERFKSEVLDDFVHSYARGETANPRARASDHARYGWLLDPPQALGPDAVAPGSSAP